MRPLAAIVVLCACGAPAQMMDEASITYHVAFTAEPGVSTRVIFPLPTDASQMTIMEQISVTDGGTVSFVQQNEGLGCALDGHGSAEATFFAKNLKGFAATNGAPDATLSMQQPDAGPGDLYVRVNKGGNATVDISFLYTAAKSCGNGCGGSKSWKFDGAVGLALQPVHMDYSEGK